MCFIGPDVQPSECTTDVPWEDQKMLKAMGMAHFCWFLIFSSSWIFRMWIFWFIVAKKKWKKSSGQVFLLLQTQYTWTEKNLRKGKKHQHKCSTFTHAKYSNSFFKSLSKLSSLFQLHWQQSFLCTKPTVRVSNVHWGCWHLSECFILPMFFCSHSLTVRVINLL